MEILEMCGSWNKPEERPGKPGKTHVVVVVVYGQKKLWLYENENGGPEPPFVCLHLCEQPMILVIDKVTYWYKTLWRHSVPSLWIWVTKQPGLPKIVLISLHKNTVIRATINVTHCSYWSTGRTFQTTTGQFANLIRSHIFFCLRQILMIVL